MPKPDYISVGLPWPDEIVADVPSPSTPPRPAVASSLPPAPPRPAVVHAVRRTLHLGSLGGIQPMQSRNHNASRRSSCSRGSSIARDLLLPTQVERDRGADRIFTLPDATCCPTQGPIHIAIRIRLLSRPPPLPRCSLGGYSCTTPRTRDGSRFPTLTLGFMKTGATTIMRHSSMRI